MLIVELFRRTRRKHDKRLVNLKSFLSNWNNEEKNVSQNKRMNKYIVKNNENVKIKRKFKFPWWFKIIIYLICLIISVASIFFIIVQGISFGDEKVEKWISSLLISFLSSIFLTQPVKMILFTFFMVALFRSPDESEDIEALDTRNKVDNYKQDPMMVILK